MSKKPPPDEGPTERPKTPSSPPILQRIGRACLILLSRFATLLAKIWQHLARTTALAISWLWQHPRTILRGLWNGFFRIATLLGLAWLIYDRVFEADATIYASASDPQFAFSFPFAIQNNSHIFEIRNVVWKCEYLSIQFPGVSLTNGQAIRGSTSVIGPAKSINIDCAGIGPKSRMARIPDKPRVTEALVRISLEYDVDFFGVFRLHRGPRPTFFTWMSDASNPQWIKGEFAK